MLSCSQYQDVVDERNIESVCGYPLCGNPLGPTPKQKYLISVAKKQILDLTERKVCFHLSAISLEETPWIVCNLFGRTSLVDSIEKYGAKRSSGLIAQCTVLNTSLVCGLVVQNKNLCMHRKSPVHVWNFEPPTSCNTRVYQVHMPSCIIMSSHEEEGER